jgi:delta24-sterol reductase
MSVISLYYNHQKKVEELQKSFQKVLPPFSLKLKGQSNTTRAKNYNKNLPKLDISHFDKALKIDLENKTITVEPRITFENLLKITMKFDLIPLVVPEFKGITVGGAILGACAESSSFKEGLFSDTCLEYEILNGNAEVVEISKTKHQEIFDGINGSFGSLGILLSVKLKLKKASAYVLLKPNYFDTLKEAMLFMDNTLKNPESFDFIDGIIFEKNNVCIVTAISKEEKSNYPFFTTSLPSSKWFFQKIKKRQEPFIMKMENYLFRYDKAAFWMGSFLLYGQFLKEFITQGLIKKDPIVPLQNLYPIKTPNVILRILLHFLMKSQRLWGLLHKCEGWVNKSIFIQDFCLPQSHSIEFLESVIDDLALFHLWLCPIKASNKEELFNPHTLLKEINEEYYINIGIYGQPKKDVEEATRLVEKLALKKLGRKVLYAKSFYTPDVFWNIYDKKKYDTLRKVTHSEGKWLDILDKVLS